MAKIEAKKRRIGPLDCMEVLGDPKAPTIVLFHGYGADMNDLVSLAGSIQAPKNSNWYFPNGPLSVPLGGHFEGRAWFPISLAEIQAGTTLDLSDRIPPGMKKSRENARAFIEKLGVAPSRLVIGGFSQGAMLSTDLMLHMTEPPAGLALLSGTLINKAAWEELAKAHAGFRFFQSHGARDQVLSFEHAQKLEQLFKRAGWSGSLQRFEGGHEIPSEVLIQLGAFLRKVLQ
jgi:phospholipase/carboxylesterase